MTTPTLSEGDNPVAHQPTSDPASQLSSPASEALGTVGVTDAQDEERRGVLNIADIVPGIPYVEAALALYRAGFRVIPGHPEKKHSSVKWGDWLDKLSPEAIVAHYAQHPDHTLCVILDERLLVLDADTPLAVTALDILEQKFDVESNFVNNTRRGQHRYYRLRKGVIARTSAHSTEAHPERIDIKAARSLVVLPPSPNKTIARCDISAVEDLVEVGQDFVDAVFLHNGSDPPREYLNPQLISEGAERPKGTATMAELETMLEPRDPDRSYEIWCKSGMGVHHETGGSEAGFQLWNRWSRRGAKYCGERELRAKWRSFDGYSGTPVTAGTLRHYLAQQGKNVAEICAEAGPGFEVCEYETIEAAPPGQPQPFAATVVDPAPGADQVDEQATVKPDIQVTPELILTAFSITRSLKKLKRELVEQKYLLDGIALMGQATVLYAAFNTGKTLLVLWLLIQAIRLGRVDPSLVIYINCDDSLPGLVEKGEIAAAHGFHMVSDGYEGFEIRNLQMILLEVIRLGQAKGAVIVLDTLKKFTDLMDKRTSSNFMKLIRKFVLQGGTVLMLAHANKKPGPDGKPVYEGTSDILNDADGGYTLWVSSESGAAERIVEFERKKGRGNVRQRLTFAYSGVDGLSYEQLLASVRQVGSAEAVEVQVAAAVRADAELVGTAKDCIREGIVKRMDLLAAIAQRSKCGRRKAQELLDKYTGNDPMQHNWTFDVQARGAKVYRLLEPDAASMSTSRETGHE